MSLSHATFYVGALGVLSAPALLFLLDLAPAPVSHLDELSSSPRLEVVGVPEASTSRRRHSWSLCSWDSLSLFIFLLNSIVTAAHVALGVFFALNSASQEVLHPDCMVSVLLLSLGLDNSSPRRGPYFSFIMLVVGGLAHVLVRVLPQEVFNLSTYEASSHLFDITESDLWGNWYFTFTL